VESLTHLKELLAVMRIHVKLESRD
jgi:hypothetical protein